MKTALITGGAGFIGSHLCDFYLEKGYAVLALDDLSTGRLENLDEALKSERFRLIECDVRDDAAVCAAVQTADLVVHLAARVGLKIVVESALETLNVNVDGTATVLRHAAARKLPTLIASTSEVYGLTERYPSHEDDPVTFGSPAVGRWSYASSKACDESLALAYFRERGLPVTVVRLFNTVGPRQSAHYGMVLPRFVRQATLGHPLTVYGDGKQTRCFAHVRDIVPALAALVECSRAAGRVFNLGNPEEISIAALAATVIAETGSNSQVRFESFESAYGENFEEIMRRVPDVGRAADTIGFKPAASLADIVRDMRACVPA